MDKKKIDIIVPAFNEQDNIDAFCKAVFDKLDQSVFDYKIVFIDDGSTDSTLKKIELAVEKYSIVNFISFSRNFGKDNALKAGIDISNSDAVVTIDADLQHPVEFIENMIVEWQKGNEIVYAVRENKDLHNKKLNNISSTIFYFLVNKISNIDMEFGVSDFRLIDKKVVEVLKNLPENDPFYRGLVKWVGFKQISLPYTPNQRNAGATKYSNKALLRLAVSGITSFSIKPLGIAIYLGFIFAILSLLYIPYVIISYYLGYNVSGWASLIVTVVFFGGLQLMILGIIGMYLGKAFMQSKQRPHYIIKQTNVSI